MPLAEIPLSVWRKRGQTFKFRGQTIHYWTAGQGEPLLLIHGFPSASWDWHYLWQPLAQRYRVIACDMLGFGDSAKPVNHEYSLLEQADLQLGREPLPLPRLELNPAVTRLEDFRFEDVRLVGYEPHPHIPAPVAV